MDLLGESFEDLICTPLARVSVKILLKDVFYCVVRLNVLDTVRLR
jgi:hypothetical protein